MTIHRCINCGHTSTVKSNFKKLSNGNSFCVKKCLDNYHALNDNNGARKEKEKPE